MKLVTVVSFRNRVMKAIEVMAKRRRAALVVNQPMKRSTTKTIMNLIIQTMKALIKTEHYDMEKTKPRVVPHLLAFSRTPFPDDMS